MTVWAGAGGLLLGLVIAAWMGRGRYRRAGETPRISGRGWLLFAPVVALAWAALAGGGWWSLPAMVFVASAGAAAVVDLEVQRLPNRVLGVAAVLVAVAVIVAGVATGEWARVAGAAGGAAALFGGMLLLSFVGPLGGGDIKLAGVMGAVLGVYSWAAVAVGILAGMTLGGVAGGAWILVTRRGRATQFPLGPALVAGTVLSVLAAAR